MHACCLSNMDEIVRCRLQRERRVAGEVLHPWQVKCCIPGWVQHKEDITDSSQFAILEGNENDEEEEEEEEEAARGEDRGSKSAVKKQAKASAARNAFARREYGVRGVL